VSDLSGGLLMSHDLPLLAVSMSIMRPGVHTMISQPRFSSAICSEMPVPPYTHTQRSDSVLVNLRASLLICSASSRVGVMITAAAQAGGRVKGEIWDFHACFRK
jgi:hypothetical protein